MANFHCLISRISRGKGQSSVAAASYRAGVKLEYGGTVFDYSRKKGVQLSGLVGWDGTRQELWRAAENAERENGVTAREVLIALPKELTDKQRHELVQSFSEWLNQRYGCAVDFSIHEPPLVKRLRWSERNPDDTEEQARKREETNHNWHAHILITTRRRVAFDWPDGGETLVPSCVNNSI